MAPEYGATMGFFPVDEETCRYLRRPAAREEQVDAVPQLLPGAGAVRDARARARSTTASCSSWTLATVEPSVAGPKRPQDRIDLPELKEQFLELLLQPLAENGYNKTAGGGRQAVRRPDRRDGRQAGGAAAHRRRRAGPGDDAACAGAADQREEHQPETEIEMMQNRPTPDRVEEVPAEEFPQADGRSAATATW